MNTDYTDFTYNSLEQIHGISRNPGWRDSPGYTAGWAMCMNAGIILLKCHRNRDKQLPKYRKGYEMRVTASPLAGGSYHMLLGMHKVPYTRARIKTASQSFCQ